MNVTSVCTQTEKLKVCLEGEGLVRRVNPHPGLAVLPYALFEEIRLPLERDHVHPVERIGRVESLLAAKLHQQPVGAELDVLPHESTVHPDKLYR